MSITSEAKQEVERLLRAGKKIQAVKYLHDTLQVSLADAKNLVDAVALEIGSAGPGRVKRSIKIFVLMFGLVAFVLLFIAGFIYHFNQEIVENGARMEGVVVSLIDSGSETAPVIAYEWKGKEYRYKSPVYSNPSNYGVGQHVSIFVSNQNPEDVVIDRFSERWLAIIILSGIAVFFGIFCFIIVFVSRRF